MVSNLEQLRDSHRIIYEVIAGSHAYGLNVPTSDVDIRGIYVNPPSDYLGLVEPPNQVSDSKNDTTFYTLKRFFELVQTANPNIIELLWIEPQFVRNISPVMMEVIAHRDLFISKKCFHSHAGYAYAQIKKAKGKNKKVNNPQPEERPKKEDFCWFIDDLERVYTKYFGRPVSLTETNINLSECHVSKVEHLDHLYRLYYYGKRAKGVFRGDDMLTCESIPKDDENEKYVGLLIYNQQGYEKALKEWKSYWDWMKNRNESRWVDQEKGKLNYDQKNMCHCMRLLLSAESILLHGRPIVYFKGEQREYLMNIRNGKYEYEKIMADVEGKMEELEELYKESNVIPHSVDVKRIEALYREASASWTL